MQAQVQAQVQVKVQVQAQVQVKVQVQAQVHAQVQADLQVQAELQVQKQLETQMHAASCVEKEGTLQYGKSDLVLHTPSTDLAPYATAVAPHSEPPVAVVSGGTASIPPADHANRQHPRATVPEEKHGYMLPQLAEQLECTTPRR